MNKTFPESGVTLPLRCGSDIKKGNECREVSYPASVSRGEMAPSPDDGSRVSAGVPPVTDASDAQKRPPLPTMVSDPRTAMSATKGRDRGGESCQTAAKACDRRRVKL